MKKKKLFFNYQKEEKWINEMAKSGWHLIGYKIGRYTFEKGTPGEYDYCIELLEEAPHTEKGEAYLGFMEDAGIECVTKSGNWAYFRKKYTGEPFVIYTDYASRKKHLLRVVSMISIIFLLNLGTAIYNTIFGLFSSISFYVSFLNWFIVIALLPLIWVYLKNMRELKQGNE